MTIDINQFWSLLNDSQLIPAAQIQRIFSDFSGNPTNPKTSTQLAQWLVEGKAISQYQASILLAGQSGPFQFGSYTVLNRIESGPLQGDFVGRHTPTGFPVLLQFLPGSVAADLEAWEHINSRVELLAPLEHPNLTETFESVVLPDHRFVVSQFPRGSTLSEKLPSKGRVPWQKSCELVAHVARGLAPLHDAGLIHHSISLNSIWLEKSGVAQLRFNPFELIPPDGNDDAPPNTPSTPTDAPETSLDYRAPETWSPDSVFTPSSDLYAIGCLLFRLISGRPPFPESNLEKKKQLQRSQSQPELTKYDLPADLNSLIKSMMAKSPSARPSSAAEVGNLLGLFSGKSEKINSTTIPASPARLAFRKSINPFVPTGDTKSISTFPILISDEKTEEPSPASGFLSENADPLATAARIRSASEKSRRRRKALWLAPMAVALLLVVAAIVVSYVVLQQETQTTDNQQQNVNKTPPDDDLRGIENPTEETATLPNGLTPVVTQQLIDDDDQSLWETPTTGAPVDFSFLPPTPKLLFTFRVSELIQQPEGQRLLKSMGPRFEAAVKQFTTRSGVELEAIDELIVSLHSNSEFQYDPFFIVRTSQPIAAETLIQRWNRPVLRKLDNAQEIYESRDGESAYYLLHTASNPTVDPAGSAPTHPDEISLFAFGKRELVEQVAENVGGNSLSGSLRKLALWTDRDRHLNILFLRNALFNDEGQHWMGESLKPFNRELRVLIPDAVRGGLVSFHLDSGNYFEVMLDKNLDLKSDDLKQIMNDELRIRREQLTLFVAGIPSSPYWDKVRLRYDNMLSDVTRNLRWNVENGEVVANCWLPPMAAHNLIAASELVLSLSSGASTVAVPVDSGPRTLDELLATPRDLNIANPPDLNVLLLNLQNEINDDYRQLPFPFNIRLLGADLQKEGITKNQRPNELVMKQKTLAEILTSIMTGANPAKDITGPADPNCKLVWVIADDPENPGKKAILITTRAAAAEKSYELPPAFRTE